MIIDWFILAHLQLLTTIHHQISQGLISDRFLLTSIHGHKPHNVNLLQHVSLNSWAHNTTFSHVIMHTCIYRWLVTSCCWQQGAHCGNWSWQNQIISNPCTLTSGKWQGLCPQSTSCMQAQLIMFSTTDLSNYSPLHQNLSLQPTSVTDSHS